MRRLIATALVAGAATFTLAPADPACCYFSAMDRDVKQPGQRAFLAWDPIEKIESFIVQPSFEGNAEEFGMVIPTPAQPKLAEAHRDLFKTLAVFTILRPLDESKWVAMPRSVAKDGGKWNRMESSAPGGGGVKVLEAGVVGSLDYKVIEANDADGLFAWLKEHQYQYSGDAATLDFYVKKKWFFTVMKIDPKQMKRRPDGSYLGEVTPTRFTFASDRLIYPLRITRISVKDTTDALFYVAAPEKMDLPGALSYQPNFQTMWYTAFCSAVWEKHGAAEKAWFDHVKPQQGEMFGAFKAQLAKGRTPSTLEWARRIGGAEMKLIAGEAKFDREAPAEDVAKLPTLSGLVREGDFVTKCRHVFWKDEMDDDLVFVPASYAGKADAVEYVEAMPSSPP